MISITEEIDMGPIRPPSEGGSHSLLIRATRNCPWNNCTFCYGISYQHKKFELRPLEDVKKDIDTVKAVKEKITAVSMRLGCEGELNADVFRALYNANPQITTSPTFVTIFNWMGSGGKTVFLQDADSLIMKTEPLIEVLAYIRQSFPSVERITTYARAKTALKKSLQELINLKKAGLSRLHVGLETGDEDLLKQVKKGVTPQEHIRSGKKVVDAGIALSLYAMPGLGGLDRSFAHATHTADVLNEIDPDYIRLRPFAPRPGTPLFDAYQRGDLGLLSPHGMIREIGMLVERLATTGKLCFDHMRNPSYRTRRAGQRVVPLFDQGYEGYQFPGAKQAVLEIVRRGLEIPESDYVRVEELMGATL